jgi:thiamine pyrophosphate-dependent acetolactate synthase large subunit-like protein
MIKQSQRQWLDGKYYGSGVENGLSFPKFEFVAMSVGMKYYLIESPEELVKTLHEIMATKGNVFCEIVINPNIGVIPITRAGSMNSSMDPALDREPNGMKNE